MNTTLERRRQGKEMLTVILALAWPTMLEQLMQTAVQYIDTAMVGVLGTHATAAVGATGTVGWLITSGIAALGIGFLPTVSQSCGAGDWFRARRAAAQSIFVTVVCGAVMTVLVLSLSGRIPVWMQVDPAIRGLASRYFFVLYVTIAARVAMIIFGTVLRAAGDTRTPMHVGLLINGINIVFNFLLIYPSRYVHFFDVRIRLPGAGWGVVGAAAASALSFLVGGVLITAALFQHPAITPKGESLRPDREILAPCMRIALPNMLQRVGTCLGYVAFASMINALGEVATAAHTIANTVESAFYIPGYGMQTAAATLAGNALGARDRKKMEHLARVFLPLEVLLMLVSGLLLLATAPFLVRIFSSSEAVTELGTLVLRMVALSEPVFGFSLIIEGILMGIGKTRQPLLYNLLGMWGVRILGTWICTRRLGLGLPAAWACMIAHNVLLFLLYLADYFRGSWNPLPKE